MNRRGFITGAVSLLTAPMIVRASSLDYVPRLRTLRITDQTIHIPPGGFHADGYQRVIIQRCHLILPANSPAFRASVDQSWRITDTFFDHPLSSPTT